MPSEPLFVPFIEFAGENETNSEIVINECVFKNVLESPKTFVQTLVISDLSVNSQKLVRNAIENLASFCNAEELFGWRDQNPVPLSSLTTHISQIPIWLHTTAYDYNKGNEKVRIIFILSFIDNWRQALSLDFSLTEKRYRDTECLRFKQFCLANSFLKVISSFIIVDVPLRLNEIEVKATTFKLVINHLFSYVNKIRPIKADNRVGLLLDHSGVVKEAKGKMLYLFNLSYSIFIQKNKLIIYLFYLF